ncbi:peptidoglycan-binding protein [Candidatus Francisella endociliophora]|uniref:Peptidoglycan-binding protein n=1 Tax=Candidatus Francisella endociliophora TaxID=653937 RepID=A0A097EPD8_9GAMM|nr:LysM domain-containing protein [Francisella sp. FSC1006]AIT09429.1 peptidoglycan-binding protein [Francisella sp. FSC1006]
MLKGINKILIASIAVVAIQSAFSMEIYTVKSNDYLYKIAKNHSVKGVSTSEMTDAIKGINKSEIPGIVDNRIKIGDKLAVPTTKDEVEDGLTLTRNQMIQGSYNDSSDTDSDSKTNLDSKLGDNSMVSSNSDQDYDTASSPSVISQDKVPALVPGDDSQVQTYSSDINTQINSDDIEETASDDGSSSSSGSFLGTLLKLIIYIVILIAVVFIGKRIWESKSIKREQEKEILGKKKRDHLMSRISPVVSDNDFYRSRDAHHGPQEEFDFFGNVGTSEPQRPVLNEHDNSALDDEEYQEDSHEHNLYDNREKNVAVKTEKGVVFETNTDDSLVNKSQDDESQIEEIDTQYQAEQELQYINELVEQFLESEKYVEASITIQDSLEKDPNNIDLRYKLLEVYAQAGDEIAFEGEVHFIKSKNIVSMFDPLHQKIAKLRDKYFD